MICGIQTLLVPELGAWEHINICLCTGRVTTLISGNSWTQSRLTDGSTAVADVCEFVSVDLYLWTCTCGNFWHHPDTNPAKSLKHVEYLQVLIFNKSWSTNERENNLHYALPFLIKEIFRMVSREKGTTSNSPGLPGPDSWQVNFYAIILDRKSVYLIFAYILFMHRLILSYTGWLLPTLCLILSG